MILLAGIMQNLIRAAYGRAFEGRGAEVGAAGNGMARSGGGSVTSGVAGVVHLAHL